MLCFEHAKSSNVKVYIKLKDSTNNKHPQTSKNRARNVNEQIGNDQEKLASCFLWHGAKKMTRFFFFTIQCVIVVKRTLEDPDLSIHCRPPDSRLQKQSMTFIEEQDMKGR